MFFGVGVPRIMNEELGIRNWGEGFGFGLIVELMNR